MDWRDTYNRLVYRDLLGYVLPGTIFVLCLTYALSIAGKQQGMILFLSSLSFPSLFLLLACGFLVGHILSVIPRQLPFREKVRTEMITKAFSHPRVERLGHVLQDAFKVEFSALGELTTPEKYELLARWVQANSKRTDLIDRLESLRLFFDNCRVILPLSILVLVRSVQIGSFDQTESSIIVGCLAILVFAICHIGHRGLLLRELREFILVFIDNHLASLPDT